MVSKFSVLIRCITKKESGFGHLRRCLILSKQLQKKKYSVQFAIDNNKNAKKLLKQHGFSYTAHCLSYNKHCFSCKKHGLSYKTHCASS